MRKNMLMKSKRMAAFALSLSVILGGSSAAGAAELNANPNTDSAVVSEAEADPALSEAENSVGTEDSTQTDADDTGTAEILAAEETSEQTTPETEIPSEESIPLSEDIPSDTEETEASEEISEEGTETADLAEETSELDAYNGTPSKVIGLTGKNNYAFTLSVGNGKSIGYNRVNLTTYVHKPGDLTKAKDPSTGLYSVDGKLYMTASYRSEKDYTSFSNEVMAVFPADQTTDPATGLYVSGNVYYRSLTNIKDDNDSSVIKSRVALKSSEAVPVGVAADQAAGAQLAGAVDSDGDTVTDYYLFNGKIYTDISSNSVNGQRYYYVYNEISFDRVRPDMKWNQLTTENVVVNGENKELKIGYQVKINDVVETSANLLAVSSAGEIMALHTGTSATLNTLVGPGESAKIQIRGVYYVDNKTTNAENKEVTTHTAVAVGEWSETYSFMRTELKEVPQIDGLSAVLDGTEIKLTWNPVKEAGSTYLYYIDSKVPLANLSPENFGKIYDLRWKADDAITEEQKALLGDAKPSDFEGSGNNVSGAGSTSISYNREYAYHYFALKTSGTASNEYTNNTGYSNIAVVTTTKDANIPQVTGLKAEKKSDGTYDLVWNPVDAKVVIYAYEKNTLPEFFNLKLLDAKSTPTVIGENVTASTTLEYKLTSLQKKLIKKVQSATGDGMDGDTGINTKDFENIKPGVTYYFTAFTYDTINRSVDQTPIASIDGVNFTRYTNFSQASAVVSAKSSLKTPGIDTLASKNSVKLTLSGGTNPTGYQIYRQNSKKKWVKISSTTDDVYTDSNLKENTKYSYRVRAYYYDKDTKKTVYSDYAYKTVSTTQVANIAVKISMKSTSQAKVTWTKVGKAERYEIYRSNSSNTDPKTLSKKYKNAGDYAQALENGKFELVKTVKNAKTTSFTDKKLKTGETYTYVVMACYKDGKTTGYISDSAKITFALSDTPQNIQTENKGTSAKITWDADKFASKFEVRYKLYNKYGEETSRKFTVKTTKNNSYTIKGLESGGYASVEVRAYGKNKTYSEWSDAYNTTSLKAAGSITAKNATEKLTSGKTDNVVKISWKKVSGAKYYKVYRSTKTAVYNKDEKKYANQGTLIAKESNNDETYDEVCYDEYLGIDGSVTGTSAVDRARLSDGVTYYYSVVAFGEKDTRIASYVTTTGSRSAYATGKPASLVYNADLKIASLKNSKKGQVVVKYNKVTNAKQYTIYRAEKKNGTYKKLGTSKKTSYTDKKAKKGKTYYYKVVATGTNGEKANMEVTSSVKKIKVKK